MNISDKILRAKADLDSAYEAGVEKGKAEGAPEDLNDVLTAQEEKLAELSAILDKKAEGGGIISLIDRTTGESYVLYVDNGKLMMRESDEQVASQNELIDQTTGEVYTLNVSDGELSMEEVI